MRVEIVCVILKPLICLAATVRYGIYIQHGMIYIVHKDRKLVGKHGTVQLLSGICNHTLHPYNYHQLFRVTVLFHKLCVTFILIVKHKQVLNYPRFKVILSQNWTELVFLYQKCPLKLLLQALMNVDSVFGPRDV